jgi:hypothetical protein
MNEIDHFKKNVLCICDVATIVDHFHVKRIYLVGFYYIVKEDCNFLGCNFSIQ